jgi:UDP-GlcNAc:undecaprenyl-phosphate GlcNAc-1-phosphate transferase
MIFDMIYTTVARIYRGDVKSLREWVEFVGRDHLHHRLMALGCSPAQTVMVVVALAFLMGLAALAIIKGTIFAVWLLLAQAVVFYLLLTFIMLRQVQRD